MNKKDKTIKQLEKVNNMLKDKNKSALEKQLDSINAQVKKRGINVQIQKEGI